LIFPRLKPSTQAMRRNILERFRAKHGHKPVAQLERRHIEDMIAAMAKTPHAANNLLKVLRHLLEHAIDISLIEANPALKVKKFKITGDGIHTWTEDEVAQFIAHHSAGSRAYLAMMLMLWTGQRKSDAVRMGWQHMRNGKIAVRQEKTGTPLLIPISPELAEALALVPRTNMTFLLTERGAPFTAAGFGNWMRDRCDEAGLPQCSSHGLRKLTATRLAELAAASVRSWRSPATSRCPRCRATLRRPSNQSWPSARWRRWARWRRRDDVSAVGTHRAVAALGLRRDR
jgi:integrase